MTRTPIRKSGFPAFRKPAILALLAATALAGCATNRVPQFSYDADVPPLPVVQAPVTDERPRPLHKPPSWNVARGGSVGRSRPHPSSRPRRRATIATA